MTGCEVCDLHNHPSLGTAEDQVRELHRAFHEMGRELHRMLTPLVERLGKAATR